MAATLLVRTLARLPLFKGLTNNQLEEIVRGAEHAIFHPGAVIMEQNTEGEAAILIVSGEALRVSGPELSERLEPIPLGALLGEANMLVETTYGSTVVARSQVRALRIVRDKLHAQMAADREIADRLVQNLAKRLTGLAVHLRKVDGALAGTGLQTLAARAPAPARQQASR